MPVQFHLDLEVNWLVENVNELEFEESRMYKKQTSDFLYIFL